MLDVKGLLSTVGCRSLVKQAEITIAKYCVPSIPIEFRSGLSILDGRYGREIFVHNELGVLLLFFIINFSPHRPLSLGNVIPRFPISLSMYIISTFPQVNEINLPLLLIQES